MRRAVDRELEDLRRYRINAHWEPSRELIRNHSGHVLIVESFYDNQPVTGHEKDLKRWEAIAPVVLLGVYYSGVKDVAVELAGGTALGGLDVSRYVADVIRDTRPFRRDLQVQAQVFWNIISSELGKRLVVAVDDYAALGPWKDDPNRHWLDWPLERRSRLGRTRDLSGTAALLTLDYDLLEYAAFHIVRNRNAEAGSQSVSPEQVRQERRRLSDAQMRLERLADRFRYRIRPPQLTADRAQIDTSGLRAGRTSGVYDCPNRVDEMFDAYRKQAERVLYELEGLLRSRWSQ